MRTTITRTFDNHRAFHLLYTAAAQLTLGDIDENLFREPNTVRGVWHNMGSVAELDCIFDELGKTYLTELFSKYDSKCDSHFLTTHLFFYEFDSHCDWSRIL